MGLMNSSFVENVKNTAYLRAFGLLKVPVLLFLSPKVRELNDKRVVVRIPLNYRSRNHLKSMYFGSLAAGADCAGGLIAMRMIHQAGNKVNLIFKDFHADFLKRAESDVDFVCEDGELIRETTKKALETPERYSIPIQVTAYCPDKLGKEPVAKFTLTLSMKRKSDKK